MRKIEIEVVGKRITVDLEKIPTGVFVNMMFLQQNGFSEEAGKLMISLINDSIGFEQLNKFSIVSYPFIMQKWMESVIENVFYPIELGNEIDEIIRRMDEDGDK